MTEQPFWQLDQLRDSVSRTTEQLAERTSQAIVHQFISPIPQALQVWLLDHPLLAWLVSHPVWAAIGLLFSLLLLWQCLAALSYLFRQFLIALLQAPLHLGRWLLGRIPWVVRLLTRQPPDPLPDPQTRLADILSRLDVLRQEQDTLLQEAKLLLRGKPARKS